MQKTMIQEIKKLLDTGATIKFPYKTKINDRFGDVSITKIKLDWEDNSIYHISPFGENILDQDEAVKKFVDHTFSPKNIGYIQYKLIHKGINFEEYDLEEPTQELIDIFNQETKIVQEEYEILSNK